MRFRNGINSSVWAIAACLVLTLSVTAMAGETEDLAKESQNPIGNIISLPFENNFAFGVGPEDAFVYTLNLKPVYPMTFGKVWKDPYVVDRNRDETSRTSNGGRLTWDRIFGSQFQLQYTYRKNDISSEKSGDFLGLSNDDKKPLELEPVRQQSDELLRRGRLRGYRFQH
jgi:hypothetical protein